jgi:hypothetical protein
MQGRSIAIAAIVGLLAGACQSTLVPPPASLFPSSSTVESASVQPSPPTPAAGSTSPSATVAAATTRPTEVASSSDLPSAGGTCSASQIVPGKATYGSGVGTTLGTTSVYITQPLRNRGDDCVLHLPAMIGVASETGAFKAVRVVDAGTENSTGGSSPTIAAQIRSGRSLPIVFGAWWWSGVRPENGTPLPAPPCADPISDVTRVEFPLAAGTLQIDLPTVVKLVCSSPASMSLTIENPP